LSSAMGTSSRCRGDGLPVSNKVHRGEPACGSASCAVRHGEVRDAEELLLSAE
jgi:hypothetical protein